MNRKRHPIETALLLVAFISPYGAVAAVTPSETNTFFRARSASIPELVQTVRDSDGRLITITGRYDIGLDATSTWDAEKVAQAVTTFITNSRTVFGLAEGEQLDFVPTAPHAIDENTHIVRFHQRVGGVRVAYLDVVVAMAADGALVSIDGRLTAPKARVFQREPEQALAAITAGSQFAEARITESSTSDGFAVYRGGERYTVEPVYDPLHEVKCLVDC